jgi:hypothetical protein
MTDKARLPRKGSREIAAHFLRFYYFTFVLPEGA